MSNLEKIESETEWHDFLKKSMKSAGWHVKHEVTCNEDGSRVDFLCYHGRLNDGFENAEWIGVECKYGSATTAPSRASRQIDDRYRSKTWGTDGKKVDLWVVAPYCPDSYRGDREEMIESRSKEIGFGQACLELGMGYLFGWPPAPSISFDRRDFPSVFYTGKDRDFISTIGFPAFDCPSRLDPWDCYYNPTGGELDEAADKTRAKESGFRFSYDRDEMTDIWGRHYQGAKTDD